MNKILLFFSLISLSLSIKGQLSFPQIISAKEWEVHSFYTRNNEQIIYTMEAVNETDMQFNILNDDLTIKRSFIIADCVGLLGDVRPYGGYDSKRTTLTQTLFNDDDKFEVVRFFTGIITTPRGEQVEAIGAEIVSEDGTILGTLPEDMQENFYTDLRLETFTLGKNNYLTYLNVLSTGSETKFYLINKETSDQVNFKKISNNLIYPNPIRQQENLTINLRDLSLSRNSFIRIIDMSGHLLLEQKINNQEEVIVPMNQLNAGQYSYAILSDGEVKESGKLIIK